MEKSPQHILVIRFSALGDVAMTVPVIKNLLAQNPSLKITFLSAPFVAPFFKDIERLSFYGINVKDYKGIAGIYKLSKKIKADIAVDAIADLHNVLRTKLLRFFLGNKNVAVIDKGRKEKKQLTKPSNKNLHQLKTSFERYADVFLKLGLPIELHKEIGITVLKPNASLLPFTKMANEKIIGIAPFAKHNAKMYPLQKMIEVITMLLNHDENKILLFGTASEIAQLDNTILSHPNIFSMAGRLSFSDELNVISQLDVMLSMDSANMHLASLYNVSVVSLWGGTHPYLGFYGWGQAEKNLLQINLPCRPSSVFGNKPCPVHGDAGCMQDITPQMVVEKVQDVLS
jgi:ADP-heptose:LPS heptosyltransferase